MAVAGLRHLGLKILSISLAALLWLLVSGEQVVERVLRIPLEFTNVPSSLEIVGGPSDVVEVRVRGSSGALARIAPGELTAVLDLRDARAPQKLFHLSPADVRTPFGVEVVQVAPSNVWMQFEKSDLKTVPVVPTIEGEPGDGFVIGTVTATPSTVQLVGAASVLDTVTEAITEAVDVSGKTATFAQTVTIGSPNGDARLSVPGAARVVVTVTAAPVEWIVSDVRVQIRNSGRPTLLRPESVTVVARGPRDASSAGAVDFDASVDVSGLSRGEYDLPVRVVPPAKVGVTRVEPANVRVVIR
jgi:YbbR domain-containing protein